MGILNAIELQIAMSTIHRLTALGLFFLYSVTALCGQGLHFLDADCGCCSEAQADDSAGHASTCAHSHRCGHPHRHTAKKSASVAADQRLRGDWPVAESQPPAGHDCEHCAICQHQSLGQMQGIPASAVISPIFVEFVRPLSAESALSVEYFSPALPRAPPTV
jgi:hypothetical protein